MTAPTPEAHGNDADALLLQVRKILQLLRLRQINNGVFIRVSTCPVPLADN